MRERERMCVCVRERERERESARLNCFFSRRESNFGYYYRERFAKIAETL